MEALGQVGVRTDGVRRIEPVYNSNDFRPLTLHIQLFHPIVKTAWKHQLSKTDKRWTISPLKLQVAQPYNKPESIASAFWLHTAQGSNPTVKRHCNRGKWTNVHVWVTCLIKLSKIVNRWDWKSGSVPVLKSRGKDEGQQKKGWRRNHLTMAGDFKGDVKKGSTTSRMTFHSTRSIKEREINEILPSALTYGTELGFIKHIS